MTSQDRTSYDAGASVEVRGGLQGIVGRLELVLSDRDRAVKAAMADFTADGVSDEYHGKEIRWNRAADEVRTIVKLLRSTPEKDDGTAHSTLSRRRPQSTTSADSRADEGTGLLVSGRTTGTGPGFHDGLGHQRVGRERRPEQDGNRCRRAVRGR